MPTSAAPPRTSGHVYVRSAPLGGADVGSRLRHAGLNGGGTLVLEMSDVPP
jgi:hypothetical protein